MTPPTPSNLSTLKQRGAKVMVYHGVSDPIFSYDDSVTWYRNLAAANGGDASNFARLYGVQDGLSGFLRDLLKRMRRVTYVIDKNGKIAGDDDRCTGGIDLNVRVQCTDWMDIDRVQVLVNSRPDPKLNFTRQSHPQMFKDGVDLNTVEWAHH